MIQLEGPVTIGGTDYSNEIERTIIRRRRELVTSNPTAGNARRTQKAGALVEEVEFVLRNGITAASVCSELWDAIDTDSSELEVVARFSEAAVGADNPSYTFDAVVVAVEVGGNYGVENTQSLTMPITSDGIAKATS